MVVDANFALPIGIVCSVVGFVGIMAMRVGSTEKTIEVHSKEITELKTVYGLISDIRSSVARIEGRLGCDKCGEKG